MTFIETLIKRHPVLAYFTLTFAISWGGFVWVVGPDGFPGTAEQFETLLPVVALAMLAGPSAASLLLTGLVFGRAGLRELLSRLLTWQVSVRWYAFAVLPALLLPAAVHAALSQTAVMFTTNDKFGLVLSGTVAGLLIVLEEIGWTGFAVPLLRQRHSILVTGLIVGSLWGAWHFLQALWTTGTYSGALPLTVFLPLSFLSGVAQLTVYRILLVWLYDRTGSLLVVTLMHASLTANTIFIFRPVTTGVSYLIYVWVLAVALAVVAVAVVVANREGLTRQPLAGLAG